MFLNVNYPRQCMRSSALAERHTPPRTIYTIGYRVGEAFGKSDGQWRRVESKVWTAGMAGCGWYVGRCQL